MGRLCTAIIAAALFIGAGAALSSGKPTHHTLEWGRSMIILGILMSLICMGSCISVWLKNKDNHTLT